MFRFRNRGKLRSRLVVLLGVLLVANVAAALGLFVVVAAVALLLAKRGLAAVEALAEGLRRLLNLGKRKEGFALLGVELVQEAVVVVVAGLLVRVVSLLAVVGAIACSFSGDGSMSSSLSMVAKVGVAMVRILVRTLWEDERFLYSIVDSEVIIVVFASWVSLTRVYCSDVAVVCRGVVSSWSFLKSIQALDDTRC